MDSLPPQPSPSDGGLARLRQVLKGDPNARTEMVKIIVREDSLDALKAATGEEPGEFDPDEAQAHARWIAIMTWVHETDSKEWTEKLLGPETDAGTLTWLVDKLDVEARELGFGPTSSDNSKRNAFRTYVGLLRFLKAAEEYGSVEVSRPLKVMRLRHAAARGEIPRSEVTKRKLAKKLGVSDKTIAAWDKRAQQLRVTLEDWDYERLYRIVKPLRRAPP